MGLKDEHFFLIIPCFEAKCYWFIILWYTHNNLYLGADFIFYLSLVTFCLVATVTFSCVSMVTFSCIVTVTFRCVSTVTFSCVSMVTFSCIVTVTFRCVSTVTFSCVSMVTFSCVSKFTLHFVVFPWLQKQAGGTGGLCGRELPPIIYSSGAYLTVYFRWDE